MRSPGGFPFCFVTHPAATRPAELVHDDGTASIVDQVCLDLPAAAHDEECAFWEAVTGQRHVDVDSPEFSRLVRADGQPLQFLLQLLDETSGRVRGHLDLAADDRAAEVRRHVALGARLDAEPPTGRCSATRPGRRTASPTAAPRHRPAGPVMQAG